MRGYRLVNQPIGSRRMAKRKGEQPTPQAQERAEEQTTVEPAKLDASPAPAEAAAPELAKIEAPAMTSLPQPEVEPQVEPVAAAAPVAASEPAPIVVSIEPPKPEISV